MSYWSILYQIILNRIVHVRLCKIYEWFLKNTILQLLLLSVLNTLFESVSQILRKEVEKRAFLQHLDSIMLAVDEICDSG